MIPVEFNPFSSGMVFSNLTLYMNSADGHYHLSGSAKNTLKDRTECFDDHFPCRKPDCDMQHIKELAEIICTICGHEKDRIRFMIFLVMDGG